MDIYGDTMAPYYGSFIILSPLISGQVVDTNGVGVRYVTLHVSGDSVPTVTDAHGNYSIEVYPSWAGTITPARGTAIFIPPSRTYTNVSNDLSNQNFVMATTPALTLAIQPQASGGCTVACYGLNGVSYQLLYSSDLVNWSPYGGPVLGTNGPMCFDVPQDGTPAKFFRFTTSY
jgi:hypothetical protein